MMQSQWLCRTSYMYWNLLQRFQRDIHPDHQKRTCRQEHHYNPENTKVESALYEPSSMSQHTVQECKTSCEWFCKQIRHFLRNQKRYMDLFKHWQKEFQYNLNSVPSGRQSKRSWPKMDSKHSCQLEHLKLDDRQCQGKFDYWRSSLLENSQFR